MGVDPDARSMGWPGEITVVSKGIDVGREVNGWYMCSARSLEALGRQRKKRANKTGIREDIRHLPPCQPSSDSYYLQML